jgi:hypothetical protein
MRILESAGSPILTFRACLGVLFNHPIHPVLEVALSKPLINCITSTVSAFTIGPSKECLPCLLAIDNTLRRRRFQRRSKVEYFVFKEILIGFYLKGCKSG